eukprot:g2064.t1
MFQAIWRRQLPFGSLEMNSSACHRGGQPLEGLEPRCRLLKEMLPVPENQSAFDLHFQRLDAIVAKLKAIPEVAVHSTGHVGSPEGETIGSILWRLSGLQAAVWEQTCSL